MAGDANDGLPPSLPGGYIEVRALGDIERGLRRLLTDDLWQELSVQAWENECTVGQVVVSLIVLYLSPDPDDG